MNPLILSEPQDPVTQPNPWRLILAIGTAFIVMLFMQSRAAKKERQKQQEWIDGLKKNTKVVMRNGIHGTIYSVKKDTVVVKIDDDMGVKITVNKDALAYTPVKKDDAPDGK